MASPALLLVVTTNLVSGMVARGAASRDAQIVISAPAPNWGSLLPEQVQRQFRAGSRALHHFFPL